jgi:hypothetical protein
MNRSTTVLGLLLVAEETHVPGGGKCFDVGEAHEDRAKRRKAEAWEQASRDANSNDCKANYWQVPEL